MSSLFQCHIVQSCLESCSSRDDERICTECIDIATTCYGGIPTPKLCFSNRLEHIHTSHTSGPVTQKLFFQFLFVSSFYIIDVAFCFQNISSHFFLDPSWNTLEYIIARAGGARGLACLHQHKPQKFPCFPEMRAVFGIFGIFLISLTCIILVWYFFRTLGFFLASQTTNSN